MNEKKNQLPSLCMLIHVFHYTWKKNCIFPKFLSRADNDDHMIGTSRRSLHHRMHIPSSHFSVGSTFCNKPLKASSAMAFPAISSCVRFSSLKSSIASQWSPILMLSFLNSSIVCLTSTVWDNGEENRYLDVSIGWEPISLDDTFNIFKDFSSFRGSNAVKLLIRLLLRFKQTRSCNASKPESFATKAVKY